MYNMMYVIVLQQKCQLALSKWRRVNTWKTLLRFFDMTLQKRKKSRFLDFEKTYRSLELCLLITAITICITANTVLGCFCKPSSCDDLPKLPPHSSVFFILLILRVDCKNVT